jgi:hypothetical protein
MSPVTAIIRVRVSRSARAAMAMARRLILLVPSAARPAANRGAKQVCLASAKTVSQAQQKRKGKFPHRCVFLFYIIFHGLILFFLCAPARLQPDF